MPVPKNSSNLICCGGVYLSKINNYQCCGGLYYVFVDNNQICCSNNNEITDEITSTFNSLFKWNSYKSNNLNLK